MQYSRRALATLFTTFFWSSALANPTSTISSELSLTNGAIRGSARNTNGVLAFKRIPYAAAPVGEFRWRSPQPPPAWQGVRDATEFGPSCWAAPMPGPPRPSARASEDCLAVNVWTAARSLDEKRPVMVWIHGGGFEFGSSAQPNTDGTHLAAKGVVLVSFNYRLGVFGFLSHPELDPEGSPSGNFGLQDQIAALAWVRANIARFGGDPDNVTIFGESAGAHSVGLLMTSPLAKGLFHRAIGESGAFWDSEHGSISTRAEAQARGRGLAERLGGGTIAGLRAIPAEALNHETAWNFTLDPGTTAFAPSIDGFALPDSPADTFARGRQIDVPLLAGWNGMEESFFLSRALPHSSAAEFRQSVGTQFGKSRLAEFLNVYPADTDAQARASAGTLIGDLIISQQTWEWLQQHGRNGKSPAYGYQFGYRSPYSPIPAHTAEIVFVFGSLSPQMFAPGAPAPGARDRELAEQMMSYWVNFARSGDPNGAGLPVWPAYDADAPRIMAFGTTTAAGPESDSARFRFLQSFRKNGRFPEAWRSAP